MVGDKSLLSTNRAEAKVEQLRINRQMKHLPVVALQREEKKRKREESGLFLTGSELSPPLHHENSGRMRTTRTCAFVNLFSSLPLSSVLDSHSRPSLLAVSPPLVPVIAMNEGHTYASLILYVASLSASSTPTDARALDLFLWQLTS